MHTHVPTSSNDQGETLVELLMAMAILGIAVIAIVGGIATTILLSDIHRKQATAGAYVRNYAEAVVDYVADGHFDASSPDYSASKVGFTAPVGEYVTSASVRCWDNGGMHFSSCNSSCTVQQVTVEIHSSDHRASETLLVTVHKP